MSNSPFANVAGNSDEMHPGPCFHSICTDGRPLLGGTAITLGSSGPTFQPIGGQLWKISNAQTLLHRKQVTTIAYVGRWALVDVSGPSSSISSTAKDSYKYCYALNAGECFAGSAVGDVYVNAPNVDYPYCYYPGFATQDDDTLSICIGDQGAYTGDVVQFSTANPDLIGAATRVLGPNYSKWNQFDAYWNVFTTPSEGALGSQVRWLDGVRTDDLLSVLPPFPGPDGVTRNTFESVPVAVPAPAVTGAQSAIVEFGYVENGSATSYYCTSRLETCVAASTTIDSSPPFTFETSEGFTPAACSTGCTIAIPSISQRTLYYRWKYLGSTGQVLQTSVPHVMITQ